MLLGPALRKFFSMKPNTAFRASLGAAVGGVLGAMLAGPVGAAVGAGVFGAWGGHSGAMKDN